MSATAAVTLRSIVAPVAAITIFGLSVAMSHPLLGLALERMGHSGFWIGVSTMAGAIATVICAPILPRVVAYTGMGALLLGAGGGLSLLMLAFAAWPDYWVWFALRLAFGVLATAIFFASEYWIVAAAPAAARGRVIAIYTISLSASYLVGPLIVGWTGVVGWLPFAVAAAVLAAGLLPVAMGLRYIPPATPESPPSPLATLSFFRTDPVILWGVVLFGVVEFGTVVLLPVWGVRAGLSEASAVLPMSAFAFGAMVLALPIGWAGDRFDRRRLLLLAAVVSVIAPALMALAAPTLPILLAIAVVWGGTAVGLYTLSLAELGARYSGARLAEGNAAVVFAYGIGALISPGALGEAMDRIPPHGLLWASAAFALAYALLVAARLGLRRRE